MEKYIYDENNGLLYKLQGNYYISCLKLSEEEQVEIGIWGQRHLEYIKNYRKGFYTSLAIGCELNRYLADVNKQTGEMFNLLVKQIAKCEGVTEKLKAEAQMELVARMNNIRQRAMEIVNNEIIYS